MNLLGQFAGRGHNQGTDTTARAVHQTIQDRQCEGRGLAGAGLGQTHDVAPLHDRWNGLLLDGGRCDIAGLLDTCCNDGVKIKRLKLHDTPSFWLYEKSPGNFRGLR